MQEVSPVFELQLGKHGSSHSSTCSRNHLCDSRVAGSHSDEVGRPRFPTPFDRRRLASLALVPPAGRAWRPSIDVRVAALVAPTALRTAQFFVGLPRWAAPRRTMRVRAFRGPIHTLRIEDRSPSTRSRALRKPGSNRFDTDFRSRDLASKPFDALSRAPQTCFEPLRRGFSPLRSPTEALRHTLCTMTSRPCSASTRVCGGAEKRPGRAPAFG